ncbi:fimbria/pilus outer membrane usher protein [Sulfitobacter sp. R18_1]|uniref:fimbria/pilus outer membrane usher protein n=1 Tax=Sulfitobacter sp. R18_1 TaxID=2821104 RepID=UPI001ADD094C|nr:fimbria/pilus outer membrane usher protein [Sulfitobacter sp. R18_1]MBO9428695.1 fimbrial biogenesis outer membrane usher protein [Sulfitobacter sp. R18_1]
MPDRFPVFLQVFINGRDTEVIREFEQDMETGEIFGARSELQKAGIKLSMLGPTSINLENLDDIRVEHDEFAQSITFYAPHSALHPTVLSARKEEPLEEPDTGYGAVLNYDLSAKRHTRNGETIDAYTAGLDGWVFTPAGSLRSSGTFDIDADGNAEFMRLETRIEHDDMKRGVSYLAGDIKSSAPAWGRSVRMGGIQVKRNFGLRSDLIDGPQLSFDGTAHLASTVEVYIDNNRVYSGEVHEGPFRVEDVPTTASSGEATIVLREEGGDTNVREVPFFAGHNLMKKGKLEYSIETGVARHMFGTTSSHYGSSLSTSASLRYGWSDRITLHGHFESASDLINVSGGISSTIGKWAEFTLASGYSEHKEETGRLLYAAVDARFKGIDFEASSLRSDNGYADLAMINGMQALGGMPATDQMAFPSQQDVFSVGIPLPKSERRLNMSFVNSKRGSRKDQIASAGIGFDIFDERASINVSGSYEFVRDTARVGALFQMQLGANHHIRSNVSTGHSGTSSEVSLSKALEPGTDGVGYEAHITKRKSALELVGSAQFKHRYGKLSGSIRHEDEQSSMEARAQGAIVFAGGKFALAPQIDDAFAIVDAGEPNIPVELQHVEIAHTGWTGRAVVTGLNSYRENQVSIDPSSLPETYALGVTAATVIPARGAGVLVDMRTSGTSASTGEALGVIHLKDGTPAPIGSEISVNGLEPVTVGYDGMAWMTGLAANNTFSLVGTEFECSGRFSFSPTDDIQQQIDHITCD